jgi:hypothetical protein
MFSANGFPQRLVGEPKNGTVPRSLILRDRLKAGLRTSDPLDAWNELGIVAD